MQTREVTRPPLLAHKMHSGLGGRLSFLASPTTICQESEVDIVREDRPAVVRDPGAHDTLHHLQSRVLFDSPTFMDEVLWLGTIGCNLEEYTRPSPDVALLSLVSSSARREAVLLQRGGGDHTEATYTQRRSPFRFSPADLDWSQTRTRLDVEMSVGEVLDELDSLRDIPAPVAIRLREYLRTFRTFRSHVLGTHPVARLKRERLLAHPGSWSEMAKIFEVMWRAPQPIRVRHWVLPKGIFDGAMVLLGAGHVPPLPLWAYPRFALFNRTPGTGCYARNGPPWRSLKCHLESKVLGSVTAPFNADATGYAGRSRPVGRRWAKAYQEWAEGIAAECPLSPPRTDDGAWMTMRAMAIPFIVWSEEGRTHHMVTRYNGVELAVSRSTGGGRITPKTETTLRTRRMTIQRGERAE